MATLAEAFIKGGIGTLGFVASAVTLAKFIVSTPVVRVSCCRDYAHAEGINVA